MPVNGADCSIVIKTAYREWGIPYGEETIRQAYSLLKENAAIEGAGPRGALRKKAGVTGCVVTPLTIGAAPLLLYVAMGSSGLPLFVSETRNVYQYHLGLIPVEDSISFDVIQYRGNERKLFEQCRVKDFELRFERDRAVRLKIDLWSERPAGAYPYGETAATEGGEFFSGNTVVYRINGVEYNTIYGLTLSSKKEGGTRTDVWIKRVLEDGPDIPEMIEELTITASLVRTSYEFRSFGTFRVRVKQLVLTSDETVIDCADGVIGPLRYYAAGTVTAEVFNDCGGNLA